MRTSAAARFDGRMNVVSDRLNWRASACIARGIELAAVFDHAQRIAGEARATGGEHIEDPELEFHRAGLFHNARAMTREGNPRNPRQLY